MSRALLSTLCISIKQVFVATPCIIIYSISNRVLYPINRYQFGDRFYHAIKAFIPLRMTMLQLPDGHSLPSSSPVYNVTTSFCTVPKSVKNTLVSFGLSEDELHNTFEQKPQLLQYSAKKWQLIVEELLGHGFKISEVKEIITEVPQLLDLQVDQLSSNLSTWRELKTEEKVRLEAFMKCPQLLLLRPNYIAKQFQLLLDVFTWKDVQTLLLNCPNVFFDDWETTMEKMNYLLFKICLEQYQIVKCNALSHSMQHIKTRHQFLLRAGLFKTPKPNTKVLTNPSPKTMLNLSDRDFVKYFKLTLEEYVVFYDLLEKEIQEDDDLSHDDLLEE